MAATDKSPQLWRPSSHAAGRRPDDSWPKNLSVNLSAFKHTVQRGVAQKRAGHQAA